VAEDHGAPGAKVVDGTIAVGVGEVGAGSGLDEGGLAATARKARTGELTPPGKKRSARCWRAWERVRMGAGVWEVMVGSV